MCIMNECEKYIKHHRHFCVKFKGMIMNEIIV